jgi:iron complex transport system substrate-binding protein
MYINQAPTQFTKREIVEAVHIWDSAAISLLDIQHKLISPVESLYDYCLNSSTFLFIINPKAKVCLNGTVYMVDQFGLFHGGKGTNLSVFPKDSWLEYYSIQYKAGEPPFQKKEFNKRMLQTNPFIHQYGLVPENPLLLSEIFRKMFEVWKNPHPLNRIQVKTLFYQLVYEAYSILEKQEGLPISEDKAVLARQYIDKHFQEDVSIRELAANLEISESHLRRIFNNKYNKSPQEYLTKTRLNNAKDLLKNNTATVKSIAKASGYTDEFYFSRLFFNHLGLSPSDYRAKYTTPKSALSMAKRRTLSYNEQCRVSNDELKREGDLYMFRQKRSIALVASWLSVMMLATGCSTASNKSVTKDSTSSQKVEANALQDESGEKMRTISTTLGDVDVPVNPKRVVVQYLMGDIVSLGITPVGVSDVYEGAAFADKVTDSVNLGWFGEWEVESVMALDPDLIIIIGEDYAEDFSKIAPTVYVPYGEMTQKERITFIGDVLNRQKEAAASIDLYDSVLEASKSSLSEAGVNDYTISVFENGTEGTMSVKGNQFGTGSILYKELGIAAPKEVQTNIIDKESASEEISFEVLSNYSGDFIIHNVYEGMEDLTENPIWNSIPAVKNNRVIPMEFGFSYYPDIYSAMAQINYLTESLIQGL